MESLILILSSLLSLILVVNGVNCPQGSSEIDETKCLYPVTQPQFYQDATWQCETLGGVVPKLTSAFDNNYVYSMAPIYFTQTEQWIGVQRTVDGTWLYQDHSTLTYQNWASGEPTNTSGYNCAMMTTQSSQWMSADCSQPRPFFCIIPPVPIPICPTGWTYFNTTNSCYYLKSYDGFKYTFDDAEKECKKFGDTTHLASIHSAEEDDFVYNMAPRDVVSKCSEEHYVWLGLDGGNGKKGSGSWTDGTKVDYPFGDLGGSGYLGMPKASDDSGFCTMKPYDWYSSWVTHTFGRYICKKKL